MGVYIHIVSGVIFPLTSTITAVSALTGSKHSKLFRQNSSIRARPSGTAAALSLLPPTQKSVVQERACGSGEAVRTTTVRLS